MARWTADGDSFRFRAGRPSLDLCSTLLWRHREPVEQLRDPADLARWLCAAGLCGDGARATPEQLASARALREAGYRLFGRHLAGRAPDAADIAVVNATAAHPDRFPQLTPSGGVRWSAGEPVAAALATVARDCIDVLTGPLADRLRECAAPDCAFLFVDTSRPGTRRWCAQNRCGNRQHVRDHRARRSPEGDGP
ncbi:CGNR zinc finger domain-containing protein [Pseudonocardia acaciae]|uniref:CGNR zinc finger domain-containing protein n=1 Tax=Pseudonocardia acaciae TaxID=551276 RepID=UPI00055BE10C|nr:ABATE domain-containing protein [Pseudonocardia acaciae]